MFCLKLFPGRSGKKKWKKVEFPEEMKLGLCNSLGESWTGRRGCSRLNYHFNKHCRKMWNPANQE